MPKTRQNTYEKITDLAMQLALAGTGIAMLALVLAGLLSG